MLRLKTRRQNQRNLSIEQLESRHLLTAVPFGPEIVIDTNEASDILIVMADLDGDGDIDQVGGDDGLFWYENTDGDGTFGAPQTIATAGQANNVRDIDVGDIDRDGDLDVVASSASDDTVQWWANDGAGGFGAAQNVVTGDNVGSSVALVDYDHDGDLDILTNGDTVDWYANNGSGTFTAQSNFTFGMNFLDAADFDRDGTVDIVAADIANDSLTLLTASGSASVAINNPGNLIAVDLDGDGDQDVVATSEGDGSLVWYENDGSAGSFFSGNPSPQTIDGALSGAFDVRAGDFDKDGDLDLLASGTAGNIIACYENDGAASPSFTKHTLITTAAGAENVAIADIDGDGNLDMSYVSSSDNRRVWRRNLAFLAVTMIDTTSEVTIDGSFANATSVTTADVDGDGDLDVLGAAARDDDITWWENTAGDGSAWTEHTIDGNFDGALSVTSADLDGDGDLDVLGAARSVDDITWWENTAGDGSAWTEHTIDGNFNAARSVTSADLDGDGDLDVLGAADEADDITWWENTAGDGSAWTEHTIDGNFDGAFSVTSADLDGDGDLDVLGAANSADDTTWWENTAGDGSAWTEHTIDGNFDGASSVTSADLDGDGDLDVLGAADRADDIAWWENTAGDGSAWTEHTIDGNFNGANSVTSEDLDGDGDLDVLGAAILADDITWWENTTGDGSAWTEHTIDGNFDYAFSVTSADLDGDGDLDVLGAAAFADDITAGDITWWENRREQVRTTTISIAPLFIGPGEVDGLFRVDLAHLGQIGDPAAEFDTVSLRVENQAGVALSDAEANDLFERLEIYRDDGDGVFNGSDGLASMVDSFTLNDGVLRISLVDGDPNSEIAGGSNATFFLVATIAADADRQQFRVIHLSEDTDGSIVTYDGSTARLLVATQPNTPSPVVNTDIAAPNVLSIVRNTPTPSTLSTLTYDVTFDEEVAVNPSDFSLTTTGSVTGTVQSVTGTGEIRTITVGNIQGEGTLRLDVDDNHSITDLAGNELAGTGIGDGNFQGEVYTLDHLPPQVLGIVRFDAEPVFGAPLRFLVNFNESVTGVDATDFQITTTGTASGTIGTIIELLPSSYLVEIDNVAGEGTIGLNLIDDDSIVDTVADPAPFPLGGVGMDNGNVAGQVYALAPEPVPGDYDLSGTVDSNDYSLWKSSYGQTVAPGVGADGNRDGVVDLADYTIWRNNLGATQPAVVAIESPAEQSGEGVVTSTAETTDTAFASFESPTISSSLSSAAAAIATNSPTPIDNSLLLPLIDADDTSSESQEATSTAEDADEDTRDELLEIVLSEWA